MSERCFPLGRDTMARDGIDLILDMQAGWIFVFFLSFVGMVFDAELGVHFGRWERGCKRFPGAKCLRYLRQFVVCPCGGTMSFTGAVGVRNAR